MKTPLLSILAVLPLTAALADNIGIKVRFGLEDKEASDWSGTVTVSPGSVSLIGGWRFTAQDKVDGITGWSCRTRPTTVENKVRSNNPKKEKARLADAATALPLADNGVMISFAGVSEDSKVTVKTAKGEFTFAFSEIPAGKILPELSGAVEVERAAAAQSFTADAKTDDDYPSGAIGADGTVWACWQSFTPGLDRAVRAKSYESEPADLKFLATAPGGDQLWLRPTNGAATAITTAGRDIYKSAVAVDGAGLVWVVWAENAGYKPFPDNPRSNFDIFTRSLDPKTRKLSEPVKLSDSPENDVWPVAATDSNGHVWVAWQGARENVFRIFERHQIKDGWSKAEQVSTQTRNCWAPAIASTKGKMAIAWDTYEKGDYDVWVREFGRRQSRRRRPDRWRIRRITISAAAAMTYDPSGALWIAWEKSGPTWGKDFGALVKDKGIGLYRDRQIGMAVLAPTQDGNGQWMRTRRPHSKKRCPAPGGIRKRASAMCACPRSRTRRRIAQSRGGSRDREEFHAWHNQPRAASPADKDGRIWLFCRSRQNDFHTPLGSLWFDWACYSDGDHWAGPIFMPHSDNLLYNTPAVVPARRCGSLTGGIQQQADHRQDREIVRTHKGPGGNLSLESDNDPYDNDLYLSHLRATGTAQPTKLVAAKVQPDAQAAASPATTKERADLANIHAYRVEVNGKKLQIQRGEFHRHTEISGDGGNDGPLEDMWRYAIDVAQMDWLGCGDHDNGAGREYPWWLTQKTTDAFYLPGSFNGMYTYERSVRYPEGHRNVIFTRRGIRTLPRLPVSERNNPQHAPDTQMLYKYLHLFNGICASHTSATNMGTDWRDNDPKVEPFVEIYQGCRQNYERPGAPRCPTADDAIGGWEPLGFINLALKQKGYHLAFESSSDHGSTHISYTLAYAENSSREAIFNAMQARHVYAATDNIVADFRCGAHMMGDEFDTGTAPKFKVHLEGTGPFAKVVFVKDDEEVFTATPNQQKCDIEWADPQPTPGQTSYYYVRGEQADGELVWASPMWIKFQPRQAKQ